MNVQRYKVGYYSDEWGMSSNTPCLLKDDNGYAVKLEDYEQLRQRVQELEQSLTRIVSYYDLSKSGSSLPSMTKQAMAEHENTMFGEARKVLKNGR